MPFYGEIPQSACDPTEPFPFIPAEEANEDRAAVLELLGENRILTLRIVEFRLALKRITENYPPDTIAGRLAAEVLAKYPSQFENAK